MSRTFVWRAGFAAGALSVATPARVEAQEPTLERAPAQAEPHAVSLTVGGGVSLGAYEAGYVYYLLETFKANPRRYMLRVATGTSAGSANALLAAMTSCSPPEPDPRASLLFNTWVHVGFNELFLPAEVTADGLFSRRALHRRVDEIAAKWNQGLPETCDVVLGITATRVVPRPLVVRTHAFSLPRIEEKFVVRLKGRGAGRAPHLSNYVDPDWGVEQALLPVDGSGDGHLQPLSDAVLASMSFPIAFAPMPLRHCMTVPPTSPHASAGSRRCSPDVATTTLFSDGGLLDNQPLRLAERIMRGGLVVRGTPAAAPFRDIPNREGETPDDARFIYLDTDTRTYPAEMDTTPAVPTALGTLERTLTAFVKTARAKNLITLFENRPQVREQLTIATTPYPPISEALGAFFGFFDKKLRAFDFDLGMFAAHALVMDGVRTNLVAKGESPLRPAMESFGAPAPRSVRSFTCVRGVLEPEASAARVCADPDVQDTRILIQATLDRLYSHCRNLGRAPQHAETQHVHCRAALEGAASPIVPGITPQAHASWQRGASESDFDHTMRLLAIYGFVFSDLGLGREDASEAKLQIRAALGKATDRLVAAQPEGGTVLDLVTQPALNSIAYMPPRHLVYGTLGGAIEAGWSFTNPVANWRWFRPGLSITVQALATLTGGENQTAWVLPAAGFEVSPHALTSAAFQLSFGARTGFSFSTADRAGLLDCERGRETCSRWAVTGLAAASMFGRVRFQLEGVVLPGVRTGESTSWAILPSAGLQLQWH